MKRESQSSAEKFIKSKKYTINDKKRKVSMKNKKRYPHT